MNETITILAADVASLRAAIKAGITSPTQLANWIDGAEIIEDCLVCRPDLWHAADDSGHVVAETYDSGEEAAQGYVDGGDWGDSAATAWISVSVWLQGIDSDGDLSQVAQESHTITIDAQEPECPEGDHDWQSPWRIVGGIKENPGVWGHGGGVRITNVCMHCGCGRHTDTWAQNPSNGEQGLTSVSYVEHEFASEIAEELA